MAPRDLVTFSCPGCGGRVYEISADLGGGYRCTEKSCLVNRDLTLAEVSWGLLASFWPDRKPYWPGEF